MMDMREPDHYDLYEPDDVCDACGDRLILVTVPHENPAPHWPAEWLTIDVCQECEVEYDRNGDIVRDEEESPYASQEESSQESSA